MRGEPRAGARPLQELGNPRRANLFGPSVLHREGRRPTADDEDDDFTANAGRRAPPREAANRVEPISWPSGGRNSARIDRTAPDTIGRERK